MALAGYSASIFIGISLGLVGGGGSILTLPVLVYIFGIDPILATVYSLFIVGSTSIVGSLSYFKQGLVNLKAAALFGIPSIMTILITRKIVLPSIPVDIFHMGHFTVTKNLVLMLLFALLMLGAAKSMIMDKELDEELPNIKLNKTKILLQGLFTGLITGLIGAGGGFLIIPALVKLVKLPIKIAIGTSLLIIAVNSLMGFTFSIIETEIQWSFLLPIALIAILGIVLGSYLSSKL